MSIVKLFTLVLCLLFIFPQPGLAECHKIMRWNDDAPFTFADPKSGEVVGISVDIAREALRRMDCRLKLTKLPWARALEELRIGRIDLISGAYKKKEREVYALFSTQGIVSPNVLFLRTEDLNKWQFNQLSDLIEVKFQLGAQINVSYSKEYDQLIQTEEFSSLIQTQSDRNALWKMLAVNRIDGVIADTVTGRLELKQLGLGSKIKASPLVVSNEPSYFAFSRQTTGQDFVDRFDRVVEQMREEGVFDQIVDHYLD